MFVSQHDLGKVLGPDGTLKLLPEQVRIPDVCFISWGQLRDKSLRDVAIPPLVPDLAVEILSPGNTKREMDRKLREYFQAGVRLVWYVDPRKRIAHAYTAEK